MHLCRSPRHNPPIQQGHTDRDLLLNPAWPQKPIMKPKTNPCRNSPIFDTEAFFNAVHVRHTMQDNFSNIRKNAHSRRLRNAFSNTNARFVAIRPADFRYCCCVQGLVPSPKFNHVILLANPKLHRRATNLWFT